MVTKQEYALMSEYVYTVLNPAENKPLPPKGWTALEIQSDDAFGFSYGVFQRIGSDEIVLAYTGTNEGIDWLSNILGGGGLLPAPQALEAAMVYELVKETYGTDESGSNISFTGHSLGGGLASLMSVWFDHPATVFDEAPFQTTALNPLIWGFVREGLVASGYSDSALDGAITDFFAREANVTNYWLQGEVLNSIRFGPTTIDGDDQMIELRGGKANPVQLHSIALLAATSISEDFRLATYTSDSTVSIIMDTGMYAYNTGTSSERNFLVDLIRSQQISGDGQGKLGHFSSDLRYLASQVTLQTLAVDAITAQAVEWYYFQPTNYPGGQFFAEDYGILRYTTAVGDGLSGAQNKASAYTIPWIEAVADDHDDVYGTVIGDRFGKWSVVSGNVGKIVWAQDAGKSEAFIGAGGDDTFGGSNAADVMFSGAGNDSLEGFGGADSILGGAGDDHLDGGAENDELQGGEGYDTYEFHDEFGSDTVCDSDSSGQVLVGATVLTGGVKEEGQDHYEDSTSHTQYYLFGSMLHIHRDGYSGSIHIDDWDNGDLGIRLEESPRKPKRPMSPIVLDLNGDGVRTLSISAGVHFDHDASGFAERTGWVGAGDALLARDLNGNGQIDTGRELFGSETLLANGARADNGFSALAELDGNRDGQVDASDAGFGSLRAWVDADADGITDAGELLSMSDAGIRAIAVNYTVAGFTDEQGNRHEQLGTFTSADGSAHRATDVWFNSDATDSIATGAPLAESADIAALPDIEGYGTVRSLHQAMAVDATLKSLVTQFTQATTDDERARLARDIVWRWTGADSHAANSRGQYMSDARWLYMVEAFTGIPFVQSAGINAGTPDPGPNAAEDVYVSASQQYELMFARLMGQTHLKSLMAEAVVTWSDESHAFSVDLSQPIATLVELTNADRAKGLEQIGEFTRALQAMGQMTQEVASQLLAGLSTLGSEATALVTTPPHGAYGPEISGLTWESSLTGNDSVLGTEGSDTLLGGAGNDTLRGAGADDELAGGSDSDLLDGGAGNDRLYGGDGADTYLFGPGAGQDTILNLDNDGLGVKADTIIVSAASTGAVAKRLGDDLVLTIAGCADRMTVVGYFEQNASTGRAVESIVFTDGVTWDIAAVKSLVLAAGEGSNELLGSEGADAIHALGGNDTVRAAGGADQLWGDAGNDELSGDAGNDTLDGGAGDDTLDGGLGDDIYEFSVGSGHDTLREGRDGTAGGNDTLHIQGVAPDAVKLSRDRTDIVITLPGQADDVRLQGALDEGGNAPSRIEQVMFDDGTVWSFDQLKAALAAGTSGADRIEGFTSADTLSGGAGDDTLYGFGGDDRLEGGSGTDLLDGGGGNNTFVFGRGDGHDTVAGRSSYIGAGVNTLELKAGIQTRDVLIRQTGYRDLDIEISIAGSQDSVLVQSFAWDNPLQQIRFADGTVWDLAAIQARIFDGTPDDDRISGTEGDEDIAGQGGSDDIDGGAGNDSLDGGSGNDTLQGREGDDVLDGGSGDDNLFGYSGLDTLRGREGSDLLEDSSGGALLEGGAGDDEIRVAGADTIEFGLGDGHDIVRRYYDSDPDNTIKLGPGIDAADITLTRIYREVLDQYGRVSYAGYFDLQLTIKATGESILIKDFSPRTVYGGDAGGPDSPDNPVQRIEFADGTAWDLAEIRSQAGKGGQGNDTIVGFMGPETLEGGAGDDLIFGYRSYDTSDFYMSDWEASPDLLVGGAGADDLYGGELDTLDGGEGNDGLHAYAGFGTLWGGSGDDDLDGAGDAVLGGGTGQDWLSVGLRNTVHFDRGDGQDTLLGAFTTDTLEQAMGARLVLGGGIAASDVTASFTSNNGLTLQFGNGDQINLTNYFEAQGQADNLSVTVQTVEFADQSTRLLSSWLQNGTSASQQITGTTGNDLIAGYAGNDTLNGGNGSDGLQGGYGNDSLVGGSSNDTMAGGAGVDKLVGGTGDDVYYIDGSDGAVVENANEGIDTVHLCSDDQGEYVLAANVENIVCDETFDMYGNPGGWFNATGNSLNNRITGNQFGDVLNGGGGIDTLIGGDGDDTYVVDSTSDTITEIAGEGDDTLESSVTIAALTTNVENLTLTGTAATNGTGNALNNVLTGNEAANVLAGSLGNDTYVLDSTSDTVVENAGEGTDTVETSVSQTSLAANVENMVLAYSAGAISGTGNALNNVLTGNHDANTLDGGGGVDTLVGGYGDDTYVVDSTIDTIIENADEGTDTLQSSVTVTSLAANVENLVLAGAAAIDGTGNALDNVLTGNSAANRLAGGLGDDTYVLDGSADTVVENAGEGTDTVRSGVSVAQLAANVENLTLTGTGAINGTGNALDNVLTGNAAANTLAGGLGDDTYVLDSSADTVVENADEGIDTVQSSVTVAALAANVERLVLTGTAAINGTGNALDNVLTGNAAANTLAGGLGNDTYVLDSSTDTVAENANEGIDTVQSSVTVAPLAANVENLVLTGTAAIDGTGNALDNVLTGNSAANRLAGGAGDDTYVLDSTADTVVENAGEGIDTIRSSGSVFALAANVENLVLIGSAELNGTGNALDNLITGNAARNILDGGAGSDTLAGGAGDDVYWVDSDADVVVENAGEGIDKVYSSATASLAANVENLTLTGSGATSATGNALNNVLTGNSAANTLDGGAGADTLIGGNGDDVYIVDSSTDTITELANGGNDTIRSSVTISMLTAEVENLTFTGTEGIDGSGNGLNNRITGNSGANMLSGGAGSDTLDGGGGDDWLSGGSGDDTYVVDSAGDYVVENPGDGIDTIQSSVTQLSLAGNVEKLTLTGAAAIDGYGNALNNVIIGNSAANRLNGGAGMDTLIGGAGDDTYVVDSNGDAITENANEGIDTVEANITVSTLMANVENLTLTGAAAINGTGNALNNALSGNSAANTLNGGAGVDTLAGGAGDDVYVVDSGTDTIIENAGEGVDTVQASATVTLTANVENLMLTGSSAINGTGNTLDNLITGNSAANVMTGGQGNDTYVVGSTTDTVVENADEGIDTIQSSVTLTLAANVENLTLTGSSSISGTGNALSNVITGNASSNVMTGGLGDDTYVVGSGDTVVENVGEGNDTILSSVTISALAANVESLTLTGSGAINGTGNALNNVIAGNFAANTLDGGAGVDTLVGGAGNDSYVVDSTTDTITELGGEGLDTIKSSVTIGTLAANVENLTLTGTSAIDGTGNELDNLITGNSAANVMTGRSGNDTYVVASTADSVVENSGEGADTIETSVTLTALAANVESLTLTGTSAINGTGNELNNVITGNTAANTLDGGTGVDTLVGGAGNDVFIADSSTDTIVENAGEGTDTLQSSVAVTALAANVENLTLTGTSAINGTGNDLNNVITGNSAVNVLTGGLGDDIYVLSSTTDTVIENAGEGVDSIQSSVTVAALTANVENLTLAGTGAINGTGNALDNVISGNSAANVMTGGLGNDTYVVASTTDTVIESAGEGTDTIQTSVTLTTLVANVENLTLTGGSAINGTGNALDNLITGNTTGNTLNGGAGVDTLAGGTGNDIYVVDTATDTLTELGGQGTDTVQSSVTISLAANIENLTLTGTGAIDGSGNGLANVLTGNSAANTLAGGLGDDTYVLDSTADTVIELADEGVDTIQSSVTAAMLAANVENLTLTGTSAINGTGNALSNVITGNSAANVMTGGLGDDTYVVASTTDSVVENAEEGVDTIQSSVTLALAANVENLTLTGSSVINGTGNALDNVITGNSAANVMTGGLGDDTYVVASTADSVIENAGEGVDTVQSSVTLTLAANVENLMLTGSGAINGTGNALDNVLTGNAGTNVLTGGLGNDTYIVQSTSDSVIESAGEGSDTIQTSVTLASLASNVENLVLLGTGTLNGTGNALDNLITGNVAANTLNGGAGIDTLVGGDGNDTYVIDSTTDSIVEASGRGIDTVQSSVTVTTLVANVENLTLTGTTAINGTGNDLDNTLTGNSAANILSGGLGSDTYVLDSSADTVVEASGEGIDTVRSSATVSLLAANVENIVLTGTGYTNATGNALNNAITGNNQANTLVGGQGDDTYFIDNFDSVVEAADEGADSVVTINTLASLFANVENLTLIGTSGANGTGNALNNILTGNMAANTLSGVAGDDTLDGGSGADTLIGGSGADTYRLNIGSGIDTVQENDATAGIADWAEFGAGLNSADMTVSQVGNDLCISANNGSDALVISNWYLGSQYQIENFRWADGSVSTAAEIEARAAQGMQGIQGAQASQAMFAETDDLWLNPMRSASYGSRSATSHRFLTPHWVRWHNVERAVALSVAGDSSDAVGLAPHSARGMLLLSTEAGAQTNQVGEAVVGHRHWTDPERRQQSVGSVL